MIGNIPNFEHSVVSLRDRGQAVGSERSNTTYDYSPYSNQGLKMTQLALPKLLAGLHDDIENRLKTGRDSLAHPTDKGDAS